MLFYFFLLDSGIFRMHREANNVGNNKELKKETNYYRTSNCGNNEKIDYSLARLCRVRNY